MAATTTSAAAPVTGSPGLPGPGLAWMEQQPRAVLDACAAWMQAGQDCFRAALDCQQRMIALLTEHGTARGPPDPVALQAAMTDLLLRAASEQTDACCRLRQELHGALSPTIGTTAADGMCSRPDTVPTPRARKPMPAAPAA